jgi:hypothetical protein
MAILAKPTAQSFAALSAVANELHGRLGYYTRLVCVDTANEVSTTLGTLAEKLGILKQALQDTAGLLEPLGESPLSIPVLHAAYDLWHLPRRIVAAGGHLMPLMRGEFPPEQATVLQLHFGNIRNRVEVPPPPINIVLDPDTPAQTEQDCVVLESITALACKTGVAHTEFFALLPIGDAYVARQMQMLTTNS